MVDNRGHLAPCAEFARPALRREDRYLRHGQIFQNDFRHELERATSVMFECEHTVARAESLDFSLQRGRDVARRLVRDDRDALLRLELQTHLECIPRPGNQLRVNVDLVGHNLLAHEMVSLTRKPYRFKPW